MRLFIVLFLLSVPLSALATSADDLAYYLPPEEVVWLGDDAARVLMLQQENQQAYDRGSLVHIPDWGQHPYQAPVIRQLYQEMPQYGWQSYALQAPTMELHNFAWQEEAEGRYLSAVGDEALAPLRAQMKLRAELAFTRARQTPGALIVVAEGLSAAILAQLFRRGELTPPDAFVVHGIYFPQRTLNRDLAADLAQLPFPVLDLATSGGNFWTRDGAPRRQQQAQRHQHSGYRQRLLTAGQHSQQPRHLAHHLYGWLRYHDF
jgi:hypothetical protein